MARFELDRLLDHSRDALRLEVQRVAALLPPGPITKIAFDGSARVSASALCKRFGGWKGVLDAAGVGDRYGGPPVTAKMRRQTGKAMTDDALVSELKRVGEKRGGFALTTSDFRLDSEIDPTTVMRRFGGWYKALAAAGLIQAPSGRRYSDEECFENLLAVWTHFGRPPRYLEMKDPPSRVGPKAYIVRWGTWNRALQAFVDKANQEDPAGNAGLPEERTSEHQVVAEPFGGNQGLSARGPSQTRPVPLGMRYRILVRDRFRCVICGDAPSANPACALHIDHILPLARGGLTVMENLRTLCEQCILGKGSRIDELAG